MALRRDEATRIVQFCLAGDGWGNATHEGDRYVLKLVLTRSDRAEARRFEGSSFEDALGQAMSAGVLKENCVAKQVAFLGHAPPRGTSAGLSREDEGIRRSEEPPAPIGPTLFPEITGAVSALAHQIQRERGISSLYTASGGRLFSEELSAQWRATDHGREQLATFCERHAASLPSPVAGQLAHAADLLSPVIASRSRVRDLAVLHTEIIEVYSRVNTEVLRVIDRLLSRVVEPPRRSTALAWMALLYAKEKTGIERAELVCAFERDRYFDGQYQSVLGLIAARQSYLHLFAAAAPPPAGELMRARLESDVARAVEQMERVALAHRGGGFGIDSTTWFTTISRHIEVFADVESAVRSSLSGSTAP